MAVTLGDALRSGEVERLATGCLFTQGPLWERDGFWRWLDECSWRQWKPAPGKPYLDCAKARC